MINPILNIGNKDLRHAEDSKDLLDFLSNLDSQLVRSH